ncbi:hypothetical protein [Mucilaginibacter antarcticus]|uniref:Uncharacterized protein n=1 Tax=Mucilaginibacter antarcticus TaxID=1855725 RepID=A0ABW5XKN3_9SPHI
METINLNNQDELVNNTNSFNIGSANESDNGIADQTDYPEDDLKGDDDLEGDDLAIGDDIEDADLGREDDFGSQDSEGGDLTGGNELSEDADLDDSDLTDDSDVDGIIRALPTRQNLIRKQ